MKTSSWVFFIPFFLCAFNARSQEPFICTGDFYLSQSMGIIEGFSNLFTVKVDSITQEILFDPLPTTNDHIFNSIGYRVSDNLIYGLDPSTMDFFQVDATGKSFFLRNLNELDPEILFFGADVFPTGDFMVMIGGGDVDQNLTIINLVNPGYPTEVIPLKLASSGGSPNTRIVDMAFDPLTKELYGMDIIHNRLVKISLGTGIINDTIFTESVVKANIAAMFFDAFGNLFGYGSTGGGSSFGMYRIDKLTGQLKFATLGPSTGGVDGCSCPFNISMEKVVYPKIAFPCSEVLYVFRIANGSQSVHSGIILEDLLPPNFEIVGIEHNPYSTMVIGGIGSNHLIITGLNIPSGLDSIVVRVNVGNTPPGTYGNLAVLQNLPAALGTIRHSDNPSTLRVGSGDSTYLTIESPTVTFQSIDGICEGDSAILSISIPNAEYIWQDGSTDSFYIVTEPGTYGVTATNGCDSYIESVEVEAQSIDVNFDPSNLIITLGNDLVLNPIVENTGDLILYSWEDPQENSLSCIDCSNPFSNPISDVEYLLTIENEYGCSDQATLAINVEINRNLYVANIFSPNEDSVNDRFFIQGAGNFSITYFYIYDRWGNLIFNGNNTITNNPTDGWDGTYKGQELPPGVYMWQFVVQFLDNVETKMGGSITLVR